MPLVMVKVSLLAPPVIVKVSLPRAAIDRANREGVVAGAGVADGEGVVARAAGNTADGEGVVAAPRTSNREDVIHAAGDTADGESVVAAARADDGERIVTRAADAAMNR